MGVFTKKKVDRSKNSMPDGGKIYKIINTCSIIGLFIAVGVIVLMITGFLDWTSARVGILLAIAIICLCLILVLPWVRKVEQGEFKKLAYVFLGLILLCCILWLIADIVIIKQYRAIKAMGDMNPTDEQSEKFVNGLLGSLNYLKITLFVTVQFSVASFVASVITKLRNALIPFQVIAFASYGVCDFWFSGLLFSLKISSNIRYSGSLDIGDVISVNKDLIGFLFSKAMLTILLLGITYVIISGVVIKKQEQRRIKNATEDMSFMQTGDGSKLNKEEVVKEETIEEKLGKLKNLLEKELITKEEYEAKKSEILKDM